jgi:hypothetical protein
LAYPTSLTHLQCSGPASVCSMCVYLGLKVLQIVLFECLLTYLFSQCEWPASDPRSTTAPDLWCGPLPDDVPDPLLHSEYRQLATEHAEANVERQNEIMAFEQLISCLPPPTTRGSVSSSDITIEDIEAALRLSQTIRDGSHLMIENYETQWLQEKRG